ncbi:MAG: HlyD family efflux transporter periplasmic adaptor subunit [Pseudomonadota bacterium]
MVARAGTVIGLAMGVAASALSAQDFLADGLVVSRHQVLLSSQISGQVVTFPLRPGEAFAEGDLLAEIDCAVLRAEITAAEKSQAAAQARFDTIARLDRAGAAPKGELRVTQAQAEGAEAEAEALRQQERHCTITAPFDGRVVDLESAAYASVRSGDGLLTVLDDRNLEIELIVPSIWLKWLEPGSAFRFQIFETEQVMDLTVSRVGAAIDPVSRTIKIRASIPEVPAGVLAGMTGRAAFSGP